MRSAGELATALHVLRIIRGWHQADLAAAAGVRSSAVSYYESGRKVPELRNADGAPSAMGYPLSALDETRAFIRQVERGALPEPETSSRLLALEVGNAVARLATALLEGRTA